MTDLKHLYLKLIYFDLQVSSVIDSHYFEPLLRGIQVHDIRTQVIIEIYSLV